MSKIILQNRRILNVPTLLNPRAIFDTNISLSIKLLLNFKKGWAMASIPLINKVIAECSIYRLSSYVKHSSSTVFFHCSLSWAWCSIWVHRRPICRSSCSADLLQLVFGLPRFLFPWGLQKSACLVTLLCGFLSDLIFLSVSGISKTTRS